MNVIALIPAHNEQDRIAGAVAALKAQSRPPRLIYVIADRCTDDTAQRALDAGADAVWPTLANRHKKAGALNQVLEQLVPTIPDGDAILVQDADTALSPSFLATATASLSRRRVGAVGGIFLGQRGGGILGALQRNEYARYARETYRNGGRAKVLTGTATLFRVAVLREVAEAARSGAIPGGPGYYTTASLTEDDFITKAIKTLGYRTLSPRGCEVETEVMTTLPTLWRQRMRWTRGAMDNIRLFGLTRVTLPYAARQAFTGLNALVFALLVALTVAAGSWSPSPFWGAVGLVFVAERIVTVRARGWKAMVMAGAMIPELLFDTFLNAVYVKALWNTLTRKTATNW